MSDHTQRLRRTITDLEGVGGDVQGIFNKADDALTALEDREARRSERNRRTNPRETVG